MSAYPDPIITRTAIIFDLHEPIYGSVFSIYDKWLRIAKERCLIMVVNTPFGTATYRTPQEWKSGAKRIKKFHNFDEPMIMWARGVEVDVKKRAVRKKIEEKVELSSNTVMTAMARVMKENPKRFEEIKAKLGIKGKIV